MRVAKRFITLCRARIFLDLRGIGPWPPAVRAAVLQLVLGLLEHVLVGRGERRKTDRGNGCKYENRRESGRILRTRDAPASMACGLDISAGSSLPFVRGRASYSGMSRTIGSQRRGLKNDEGAWGVTRR
jgi:hypothetical protein